MTAENKWEALREKLEKACLANEIRRAKGLEKLPFYPDYLLSWMKDLDAEEKADE